jgi:hypothetical protein
VRDEERRENMMNANTPGYNSKMKNQLQRRLDALQYRFALHFEDGGVDAIPAGVSLGASLLTDKNRIHLRSESVRTYTFFTTGFPRFLLIRGARGLQVFDLPLLTNLPKP